MKYKLVMDSSSNIQEFEGLNFASAPLKILAGEREFVDDENADINGMLAHLRQYTGKSSTACPGIGEYLDAFGDAEQVYCITISSNLSGSYNAAFSAAQAYQEQHPDRKVHVFDSLSTGAEMVMAGEKIRQLIQEGISFDEIVRQVTDYLLHVKLLFSLESMRNLANNGRVPHAVAKIAGMLGIRLIGEASPEGQIKPIGKARGEKNVVPELIKFFLERGYQGGKVRIDHCNNPSTAEKLKAALLEKFPNAPITIGITRCLCSFYAEEGGLIVGFET